MPYEIVIGFEVHTELKTRTKVWCGCPVVFGAPPNTAVCPVCLGMPGTLPVLNREALRLALKVALALQCDVPDVIAFDRKNYYYPDLPKNYQISQNDKFLGTGGFLDIELEDGARRRIGMDNIHLEEDAGKNLHPEGAAIDYSLVDLNRAGTPLLEIVTRPDIRTKEEALAFMNGMRAFLQYLDVSDCKMQEGSLRFELNMSLRPEGSSALGQKVEVKNLNSIQTVLKCIDAEYERQSALLDEGGRVASETRLWDDARGETRAMRTKEGAQDYRYFPDPDLLDVSITPALREEVTASLPELPIARRERFLRDYQLPEYDAGVLTAHPHTANYFEAALATHTNPKGISNWIMTEALSWLRKQPEDTTLADFPVPAGHLAELVNLIDNGTITGKIAKQVFPEMVGTGKAPGAIVEEKGLKPLDDSSLEPVVDEVLAAMPKVVEDLRSGKEKAIGALMGQIMKRTKGKADPAVVTPMIRRKAGLDA